MNQERLILVAAWLAYLGVAWANGGLATWIAPWQQLLVQIAIGVFAACALLGWWGNPRPATPEGPDADAKATDQFLQTLVHLLPLFLIASLGVTRLGSQAFASADRQSAPGNAPSVAEGSGNGVITIPNLYDPKFATLGEATVEGMVWTPADRDLGNLPPSIPKDPRPVLLYRFQMFCCAADARPMFITLVEPPATVTIPKNDTWVQVHGRIIRHPDGFISLAIDRLRGIPPPAQPYLRAGRP